MLAVVRRLGIMRMNDAREGDFNTVEFLLNKEYSPTRRKVSEYIVQETERPNFVVRHQAEKYDVVRAYMNSSTPQVGLYYSKFTPRSKEATICIIHGYGESTDNYIPVTLPPRRWPNSSPRIGSWST